MTRQAFLDLRALNLRHRDELLDALARVLESGQLVLGPETGAFEREFAACCRVDHCVGVGSGLEALHLILRAMGIGAGDEVIVPSNTCTPTWLAVTHSGARPVPVEPDAGTYNLDPGRLGAAITARTRAVIAVHLYGQPADMDAIAAIAHARGVRVIEDAAQAHGALYKGRPAGSLADAAAFSFYPTKNLGALGEAGAVTTADAGLAERIRCLRNYGGEVRNHHRLQGFNARLDELQAAFLRVKLRSLAADNAERRRLAETLLRDLAGLDLRLPVVPDWADPAWHLFVVQHPERDRVALRLNELGIETLVHYPLAPHLQEAYRSQMPPGTALPVAEKLQREVLSLPLHPGMTAGQVEQLKDALRLALREVGRQPAHAG